MSFMMVSQIFISCTLLSWILSYDTLSLCHCCVTLAFIWFSFALFLQDKSLFAEALRKYVCLLIHFTEPVDNLLWWGFGSVCSITTVNVTLYGCALSLIWNLSKKRLLCLPSLCAVGVRVRVWTQDNRWKLALATNQIVTRVSGKIINMHCQKPV